MQHSPLLGSHHMAVSHMDRERTFHGKLASSTESTQLKTSEIPEVSYCDKRLMAPQGVEWGERKTYTMNTNPMTILYNPMHASQTDAQ